MKLFPLFSMYFNDNYINIDPDDYNKALNQGQVKVAYGRVMILGPGGVGKSSLQSGLMNIQLPEEANSTQVADIGNFQPGMGGASREASHFLAKSGDATEGYWTPVTDDDEIDELVGLVNLVYSVNSEQSTSTRVFKKAIGAIAALFSKSNANVTGSIDVSIAREIIDKVIKKAKLYPDIKAPESDVFLYVWDCGGQQVFLCILSAFLTPKSMFVLMFDARNHLHDRCISLSHHQGNVTEHVENVTTAELLLQWMSCIHATLTEKSSTTIPPYPRILPIGTHGDDPEVKKNKEAILDRLYDEYKDKSCSYLIPHKGFIIDNTTAGKGDEADPGYKKILKNVHEFTSKNIAKEDTPVTWVLFRKVMKMMPKPYFSIEEVREIAEACRIPADSVPSVLKYYHDLAVFFNYSNIPSIKDIVIADPQWLVRQIAKLLPLKGFEKAGPPHLWKIFREKGILIEALYTEVLKSPEGDEKATTITPQAIVDLLEHFLILSPVNKSTVETIEGKQYFVPSILPSVTEDHTPATPAKSVKKAASLHVIFPNVNYLPPGYFIRLVTALSLEQDLFYLAFGHGIYRNKVSFVVGESGSQIDILTLSEHKDSVQIDLTRNTARKSGDPIFSSVCQKVLTTIQSGEKIGKWFPNIKTSFAFSCDKCDVSPEHFVPIKPECTTESHVRCQEDELYPLNEDHKYWLKEGELVIYHNFANGQVSFSYLSFYILL